MIFSNCRFYKKDDLPKKKFENMLDCISDNEIFETDHLDITFVDCINGPCRLYNYNEFDKLGSVSQNSYYTRYVGWFMHAVFFTKESFYLNLFVCSGWGGRAWNMTL